MTRSAEWLSRYRAIARVLTWLGVAIIVVLSTVPGRIRPVTGAGHSVEHVAAFASVAFVFAAGYALPLVRQLVWAAIFCGAIELLQVPLSTRHARMSDFVVDVLAGWAAITAVAACEGLIGMNRRNDASRRKAE